MRRDKPPFIGDPWTTAIRRSPLHVSALFRSNIDFTLKHEIRRASEGDVGEGLVARFLEADFQSIATFHVHFDGAWSTGEQVMDEGRGDHASAAGEGFIFHATLEGADGNVIRCEDGGEIGIRSRWGEGFVMTDRAAVVEDVEFIQRFGTFEEGHDVRHAGVDEMEGGIDAWDFSVGIELQALRLGHGDADVVADHFCGQGADDGFEGDFFQHDLTEMRGETTKTAGTISAHFGFAAVGIVVTEAKVGAFFGGFDGEKAICTDAAVAVAEGGDGVGVEVDGEVAVINDDEIIPGAVHFEEVE